MATATGPIVILTQEIDPHADLMVVELGRRGVPCLRWHPDAFPLESSLSLRQEAGRAGGVLRTRDWTLDVADVRSVWHRRPAAFRLPASLTAEEAEFARRETTAAFAGFTQLTDCLWVNHPDRSRVAASKALQLKLAAEVGLAVPRTLITNSVEDLARFFDACDGEVIYKPFHSGLAPGFDKACLTTVLSRQDLAAAHLIRHTPGIFQEYVAKKFELRVTVIGRRVFTVEIHSQDDPCTRRDWRAGDVTQLDHRPHALPSDVETACRRLLDRLGLAFGAIDMIVTPDGRYVFLENNPSGQFAWLEDVTGLPLMSALADLLVAGAIPPGSTWPDR